MSNEVDYQRYAEEQQTTADRLLKGRRIEAVEVKTSYDRTDSMLLTLDDGTRVRFDYWAEYADDGSFTFEVES